MANKTKNKMTDQKLFSLPHVDVAIFTIYSLIKDKRIDCTDYNMTNGHLQVMPLVVYDLTILSKVSTPSFVLLWNRIMLGF